MAEAHAYLHNRGFHAEAIDQVELGVVPPELFTKNALEAAGYSELEIAQSGVISDGRWPGRVHGARPSTGESVSRSTSTNRPRSSGCRSARSQRSSPRTAASKPSLPAVEASERLRIMMVGQATDLWLGELERLTHTERTLDTYRRLLDARRRRTPASTSTS